MRLSLSICGVWVEAYMYVHIHEKRMTVLACMFILFIRVCTQAYSCMLGVKLVLTINNWANTPGSKTCPYLLINARSRIKILIPRLAAFSIRDLEYYVLILPTCGKLSDMTLFNYDAKPLLFEISLLLVFLISNCSCNEKSRKPDIIPQNDTSFNNKHYISSFLW